MIERAVQGKLGKILIEQGLITQDQLKTALEAQARLPQKRIGNFLVDLGLVKEADIIRALAIQFNIPFMSLKDITISPDALHLVPHEIAKRFQVLPLFLVENELTLAINDPTKIELLDSLAGQTKCKVQPVLATLSEIESSIETFYLNEDESTAKDTVRLQVDDGQEISNADVEQLARAGKEVPIINLVDRILIQAVEEGASDIHLEPFDHRMIVRYRIDGKLHEVSSLGIGLHRAIISRIKILSSLNIAERYKPQDGRTKLTIGKKDLDIRVSIIPTVHGEKVVMRVLDRKNVELALKDLHFSPSNLQNFRKLIEQPYGIVLVTGPTGSGKTTTLYSAVNAIKSIETNIVTVEDPVEYQLPLINQVQVNPKKDLTFANALRVILRQDPDVILVGEIRDVETATIATEAALTGHLVLATLHTNDSLGTIARLVDIGVEPFLLATALLGVLAQRLVRRTCEKCKDFYTPTAEELERLGFPEMEGLRFARGKGCSHCKQIGYKGRMSIHEVLMVDETIRHMISTQTSTAKIRTHAINNGFTDMRFDGLRKIAAGWTTTEEILMATKGSG